ncbi:MAG: DNA-binding protein WhiA [Lachnospiraceae bacterium]|nr:DNA-binding protein WhiA [Lachnospiraceae bacterium]
MSFSGEVKEELVKLHSDTRHCQLAELAAILVYSKAVKYDGNGDYHIEFQTEVQSELSFIQRKGIAILGEVFCIEPDKEPDILLNDKECIKRVIQAIKYKDNLSDSTEEINTVNSMLIKSLCCKRAYLRGAYLSIGSMSNPEKGYHLEFVCEYDEQAQQIQEALKSFDIDAKTVQRKKYKIVYIKESEEIVEVLNVIGAHISLMNLENLRILKDMRNSINRKVNCEAANITKTVNAATKQIEDIEYIRQNYGFDRLSDNLREIAQVRLDYPDAPLKELGTYLDTPVGKSGVNHRLRKLSELAEKLRG